MKKLLLALCFLAIGFSLFSQKTNCPLSHPELEILAEKLLEARHLAPAHERNGTKYVPVKFFDVTNQAGDGRLDDRYYLDLLCRVNAVFDPVGVRFYLIDDKINQLFDDMATKNQSGAGGQALTASSDTGAVNIFTVSNIDLSGNGQSFLTVVGLPNKNQIFIDKSFVSVTTADVEHTMGHLFYLNHTCRGWEDSPWPLGSAACAPAQNQFGQPTEKMDGTNGYTAGDLMADTPPDYNFFLDDPDCADGYSGLARDPDCFPLASFVDVNNVMSFSEVCPPYSLTFDQGDAVLNALAMPEFKKLENSYSPPAESLVTPSDMLIFPADGAQTPFSNQFVFKWNSVPGASFYLLEIAQTFGTTIVDLYSKITPLTEIQITDLDVFPHSDQFWRVTPYNSYATCSTPTPPRKFVTGMFPVKANEAEVFDFSFKVRPNTVHFGEKIQIEITAPIASNFEIELTDPTGKILFFEKNGQLPAGQSVRELPIPETAAGVLFLKIKTGKGTGVQKLVLQKSR